MCIIYKWKFIHYTPQPWIYYYIHTACSLQWWGGHDCVIGQIQSAREGKCFRGMEGNILKKEWGMRIQPGGRVCNIKSHSLLLLHLFLCHLYHSLSSFTPPVPCPCQISEDALILKMLLEISNNYVCVHVCACVCIHDSYGSLSSCSSGSMEHSCLATCWWGGRRRRKEWERAA